MSGETDLHKLIATMQPILSEQSFVFGTLKTFSSEQVAQLQPIGTFQEVEGLTVILLKAVADNHHITYSGVFKCIPMLLQDAGFSWH